MTRKGELGCPNCDGPCLGCWELANCQACERQDGDQCEGGPRTCSSARRAALEAGIPLSVVNGESKLTDHFSCEMIALLSK